MLIVWSLREFGFLANVVDLKKSEGQRRPSLDSLSDLVGEDLKAVNALILERMQSSVTLIPQLAGHIIASGGKRLRPMLTLAAARLCGYTGERHIGLAACVEFIQGLSDDLWDVIAQSLDEFTPTQCRNYFIEAGYEPE